MSTKSLEAVIRHRFGAVILAILVATACLPAVVGQALAHASLVRAEPADGAVVATPPGFFVLTFSEPVSPLVLTLVRPDGTRTVLERFVLRDATLDIEAPTGLDNGTHVLSWRVTSADGHPVAGSAVFSIGAPSARGGEVTAEPVDWPVRIGIWLAKVALYGGLFVGVGGALFTSWIGGRSRLTSLVVASTLLAGPAAAMLSIGLQGLDALGLSWPGMVQRPVWIAGFSTSFGVTALLAAAASCAGLASLRASSGSAKALSLAAFMAVGLAMASSGHASTAQPQWLTRPAVFVHALGIAFWAGALLPLADAFANRAPDAGIILRRFSRAIPLAVGPLVIAGALLALVQLRRLDALWSTAYGQVLLIKLALLAALFLLAAFNRLRLTEPSAQGEGWAILQLRRSIRLEIVLVVVILAVAAAWRFTPPPRALIEAATAPAHTHIHTNRAMADVTITPGRTGPVGAEITLMTGDFGPLAAKEVTLILANPAAGVESIRRQATREEGSTWRVDGLNLPLPGEWSIRVDILVSDFELVKLEGAIAIRQ